MRTRKKQQAATFITILIDILRYALERFREEWRYGQLETMPYHKYLQSPEWQELRLKVKRRDGWKCTECGSGKSLHVHHLTYQRRGRERLSDLVTVCADCHAKIHNKQNVREVNL